MVLGFPLPLSQHIIKRIMTNTLTQPLHPILFLLLGAGRHAIHRVLALDHLSLRVSLTRFNKIRATAGEQFEAVGFVSIARLANGDVFERDYPPRFFVRRVFEVV